jgi:MoxR-like ATPase
MLMMLLMIVTMMMRMSMLRVAHISHSYDTTQAVNDYIAWGAGPRASQYLVLGAKCHAAISGKYSPDIEDVQAIARYVLRHRIVRNYKAEAEGVTEEKVIEGLL